MVAEAKLVDEPYTHPVDRLNIYDAAVDFPVVPRGIADVFPRCVGLQFAERKTVFRDLHRFARGARRKDEAASASLRRLLLVRVEGLPESRPQRFDVGPELNARLHVQVDDRLRDRGVLEKTLLRVWHGGVTLTRIVRGSLTLCSAPAFGSLFSPR